MNLPGLTDTEIWSLLKKGDSRAFSYIYSENTEKLYRYGLKFTPKIMLVEDTIQELFATTPPYPAIPVSDTYGGQPNPYSLTHDTYGEVTWLNTIRRTWEDKNYYYPIPEDDRLTNPNLDQNPGW